MIQGFRHLIAAALVASLAGCAGTAPLPAPLPVEAEPVPEQQLPEWHEVASSADIERMGEVGRGWHEAIERTGQRAYARLLREEGELVDPEAALPRPAPPPGPYWCRTIKLGVPGRTGYASFRPFNCYVNVEDDLLTLVKQTGSERPAGRLYADPDPDRLVFVGALALGREEEPPAYGDDPERDLIGVVERVAPFRYRLVIPFSRGDSMLDIVELVPFVEDVPTP